jgi:hypothetical protein
MKPIDKEKDLRCSCVRLLSQIPADDRTIYRPIADGFWADSRCLCKGDGIDPRLFMLWELVEDGTRLISALTVRIDELEGHVTDLEDEKRSAESGL